MWICSGMMVGGIAVYLFGKRKKWKKEYTLAALFFTLIGCIGVMACYQEKNPKSSITQNSLLRPEKGMGDEEKILEYRVVNEAGGLLYEEKNFTVTVPEKTFSRQEIEEKMEEAKKEIQNDFCQENTSIEEIQDNVAMKTVYADGFVTAVWSLDDQTYINTSGQLQNRDAFQEAGETVLLTATVELQCQNEKELYEFSFRLVPAMETLQEECSRKIRQKLVSKDQLKNEALLLPAKVNQYSIKWKEPKSMIPYFFLLLGGAAVFIAVQGEKEEKKKQKLEREKKLLVVYPDLVSKLALLLSAGMTVQGALHKITEGYLKKNKQAPIVEELEVLQREIKSGVSEYQAVIHFGDRCQLTEYRKLCSIVTQNQRMGTRKLSEMLTKEADTAFVERKNRAKKAGEEAGTKMIFPMLVMLLLVMVIIMIPAFMTMNS